MMRHVFAILMGDVRLKQRGFIQFGAYDKKGEYAFDGANKQLIAHRISGSFHWEIPLVRYSMGKFLNEKPSFMHTMTDTGSTLSLLGEDDFDKFYAAFCSNLPVANMRCVRQRLNNYDFQLMSITNCESSQFNLFEPFKIQLGEYIYELPVFNYMSPRFYNNFVVTQ